MDQPQYVTTINGESVAFIGTRISSVLSAELFRYMTGSSASSREYSTARACRERWINLCSAVATLDSRLEMILCIGSIEEARYSKSDVVASFITVGRGKNPEEAAGICRSSSAIFERLLSLNLDYIEWEPLSDVEVLIQALQKCGTVEFRRRLGTVRLREGIWERDAVLGFTAVASDNGPDTGKLEAGHLYPWVPSDDTWARLLSALMMEPGPAFYAVHMMRPVSVPQAAAELARKSLSTAENVLSMGTESEEVTIQKLQAEILRKEILERLSILENPLLACRVFVGAANLPSPVLVATVAGSIDLPAALQDSNSRIFRGGVWPIVAQPGEVLDELKDPIPEQLFGQVEATSILRTPMPMDIELPGIQINRARTAPFLGRSGSDAVLGTTAHRNMRIPVAMDDRLRFRHTYVIGQTGTGKSTLLLQMALHDIAQGRGVAVMDPHGSLIENILLRFPEDRIDDLVLVDVTDIEHPVGFNILRVNEDDPHRYRLTRDMIIDDIYSYLERTYDMRHVGGPMFETHFRGMLALLMGQKQPEPPLIPNLMVFRLLYTQDKLRKFLLQAGAEQDPVLREFINEAVQVTGDAALANMAPYISSKFSRFISDNALRNITCQSAVLDFDRIVNEGKVLLFHLGKGRFGESAAGLLASQIISRIRHAVFKRGPRRDARPFYLYADEFQIFADDRFAEILAEARKFKLSLTIAHQYVKQLDEKILQGIIGNVGTLIALRVGAIDAAFLEPLFAPFFTQRDLSSLPNQRAYVRGSGTLGGSPFSMQILPFPEGEDRNVAEAARDRSRQTYSRERVVVEKEISDTYQEYLDLGKDGPQNYGLLTN